MGSSTHVGLAMSLLLAVGGKLPVGWGQGFQRVLFMAPWPSNVGWEGDVQMHTHAHGIRLYIHPA